MSPRKRRSDARVDRSIATTLARAFV